jgi:hypothetical protein
MILLQLFYIAITLLLAGKDADSYLLKAPDDGKNVLINARVKRWHLDGAILAALIVAPMIFLGAWWKVIISAVLIRLSFFDIAFNYWANLGTSYLGGTAWADILFTKIFGAKGAVTKSAMFLALLIVFDFLIHFK